MGTAETQVEDESRRLAEKGAAISDQSDSNTGSQSAADALLAHLSEYAAFFAKWTDSSRVHHCLIEHCTLQVALVAAVGLAIQFLLLLQARNDKEQKEVQILSISTDPFLTYLLNCLSRQGGH